jgi:hypothetical protein
MRLLHICSGGIFLSQCLSSRIFALSSPSDTKFACMKSVQITTEVFVQWLKDFIGTIKPSKDKFPDVQDGYSGNTKNM